MSDLLENLVISGEALSEQQKKDLLNRLARVEGQLRGVQKLIVKAKTPADCDGIAQQLSAARKALDRSFVHLLTSSITTHIAAHNSQEQIAASVKQLSGLLDKYA